MKKRIWRTLALILCVVICAGIMSACSSAPEVNEDASSPETANTEQQPTETGEAEPEAVPAATQEEQNEEAKPTDTGGDSEITLPIVDEKISYTYWYGSNPNANAYMNDFSENPVFIEMEERTNVVLDFIAISAGALQERFNILMVSGEYPDIMDNGAGRYTAGVDAGIEDGIFIRLNELIDEFVPNYKKLIEEYPNVANEITSDEGNIVGFYGIHTEARAQPGLVIRQDMLDNLSLDSPVTIGDYTAVLTALNAEYGTTFGLATSGVSGTAFASAYGVNGEITQTMGLNFSVPFYVELGTGNVKYGPAEAGYREYLTLMNSWWEKGLIYSDFLSVTGMEYPADLVTTGQVCMFMNSRSQATLHDYDQAGQLVTSSFQLAAVSEPVVSAGDITHFATIDSYVDPQSWNITTACENVETLAQYINYWYSEEGSLLANYGIENSSMEYDGNSQPRFTDLVLNNPDGISQNIAVYLYAVESGPFLIDVSRSTNSYTEQQYQAAEIWKENRDDVCSLPSVSLTAEEGEMYNSIITEIVALTQEMTLRFIVGDRLLSEFDDFVAELETLRIDECIAIQQAALERYNAR